VQWSQNNVTKFDPDNNSVVLSDGSTLKYDYLVVANGIESRWVIPGAGNPTTGFAANVASIYGGPVEAARTYVLVSGIKPGDKVRITD
jgi:sulfide:quinone oxidoreductase